ncbi:GmrSD restriction endonuclease domain-containing protein [Pedobacter sp. 22226]|uniref:GmrSD restriction endonuclease domain-containing protein n=1 Tax=Pedobacter sp. 22226 TaxID=3453894 RepID=UPI003F87AF56
MLINEEEINELDIRRLFLNGDRYLIPIYQRNYAWGKKEIEQLIFDIRDYFEQSPEKKYYVGTLIADKRDYNGQTVFETIDGQQRLTTFNIICLALKAMKRAEMRDYFAANIISFESRVNSDLTLEYIFRNGAEYPKNIDFSTGIYEGLKLAMEQLEILEKKEDFEFGKFIDYIFNNVILVRVLVPEGTDLNHYFEIMNSRGEQLEKHEVLKARLMKELNGHAGSAKLREAFAHIWDAVADMDSYLHMGFAKDLRGKLFGAHWYSFVQADYRGLFEVLTGMKLETASDNDAGQIETLARVQGIDFKEIISSTTDELMGKLQRMKNDHVVADSESAQFQSIVNFQNFLLHVLKIKQKDNAIALDDKKLLTFFADVLKGKNNQDAMEFVLDFGYQLLKAKFLLDQYVIRRESSGSGSSWSLKMLKYYPVTAERKNDSYNYVNTFGTSGTELVLLLSMFHVSNPTMVYKNWLYACLDYLMKNYRYLPGYHDSAPVEVDPDSYTGFLVNLAKRLLRFRYLHNREQDYNEIINGGELEENNLSDIKHYMSYGNLRNNLVFNYIDYLLIRQSPDKYRDFEFSSRSSVEHYFPQNPIGGQPIKDPDILNSIGNLCLISHGSNSRLSNHLPEAKKKYYIESRSRESVKQLVMMEEAEWGTDEILKHQERIVALISANI